MNCKIIDINNIETLSIKAKKFPEGIQEAFNKLENNLTSFKGLKFYGTALIKSEGIEYRACYESTGNKKNSELEKYTIPAGKYASCKLKDWEQKPGEIKKLFKYMMAEYKADLSRPQIEFYKSKKELILMQPVYA